MTNPNLKIGTTEWIGKAFTAPAVEGAGYKSKYDKIQSAAEGFAKTLVEFTPEGPMLHNALNDLHSVVMRSYSAIASNGTI